MLSSIHPLGERSRGNRWWLTTGFHVAGAVLGGVVAGLITGSIGWVLDALAGIRVGVVALAVAAVVALAMDLGRLPTVARGHRQVNEDWMGTYRGWVYGIGYGFQLGLGVVTIVPTAAIWVIGLAAVATASPLGGALIGGAFGACRGLVVVSTRGVDTPDRLRRYHRRLAAFGPRWKAATVAALGASGAAWLLLGVSL